MQAGGGPGPQLSQARFNSSKMRALTLLPVMRFGTLLVSLTAEPRERSADGRKSSVLKWQKLPSDSPLGPKSEAGLPGLTCQLSPSPQAPGYILSPLSASRSRGPFSACGLLPVPRASDGAVSRSSSHRQLPRL